MADDGREGQRDWGGDTGALGGYGSAGLYSRRRQMERTSGGSYQNLSNAPRAAAVGGYVSMPTVGPNPVSTEPKVSGHTGPAGPSVTAQGVAGNYNQAPPQVPQWGRTANVVGRAVGAAIMGIGSIKRREKTPIEKVTEFVKENKYDPSLGGSGADIDDINLKYGLPSVRAAGALGKGPGRGRMDTSGDVAPVDPSTIPGTMNVTGSGAERLNSARALLNETVGTSSGTTTVGTPRGLPPAGGSSRATSRILRTDEPQAGLVRQTTAGVPDFPGMRPPAGQEAGRDVEAMANSYEFGNTFQGQSAGRNATRAERNARKDSNQGQIYGFDWGNG